MKCALNGVAPERGFSDEPLDGARAKLKGKQLACGWRFAYFGFKSDFKARREAHLLERHYGCNLVCDQCLASRPKANAAMSFKNFFETAPHTMTQLSHEDFLRTCSVVTPWIGMPGFTINTAFRDPMHTIYLGTAKEVLASAMGYWCRMGFIPGPNLQEQLRGISQRQRSDCSTADVRASFKTFTPANTGLDTPSEFPELGSSFKAATIKVSIWFFAKFAMELATGSEETLFVCKSFCNRSCSRCCCTCFCPSSKLKDFNMQLIAVCLWSLHAALQLLDHSDIILHQLDAEVG